MEDRLWIPKAKAIPHDQEKAFWSTDNGSDGILVIAEFIGLGFYCRSMNLFLGG